MKKLKGALMCILSSLTVLAIALPAAACKKDEGIGVDTSKYVLGSFMLDTENATTQFKIGEKFSSKGLVASATFDSTGNEDSITKDVSKYIEVDSKKYDNTAIGEYAIDVAYTYGGVTLFQSYYVSVESQVQGTIAGLEVSYSGARQYNLTSSAKTATIDLSKLSVNLITGSDANNTQKKELSSKEYTLYYSKDGGELTKVSGTSLKDLGKGEYSVYATADYEKDGETFEMSGFVTFYVYDELVSIAKKSGNTEYDYAVSTDLVGADWVYTATYATGATAEVSAKDVTLGSFNRKQEGKQSVSVTYEEEYLTWDNQKQDAVSNVKTVSGSVEITIGERPADYVDEDVAVNISDLEDVTTEESLSFADGAIVFTAKSGKSLVIEGNTKTVDDFSFTKRLKLGGSGAKDARSIKITVDSPVTVIVYAVTGSSEQSRSLDLYDSNFSSLNQAQSSIGSDPIKMTFTISEAGTYYIASTAAMNIYYVGLVY